MMAGRRLVQRSFAPKTYWCEGNADDAWKAGTNGQNDWFRIWAWTGIMGPVGVMCEERAEWGRRWHRLLIFSALLFCAFVVLPWLLLGPSPVYLITGPIALAAGLPLSRDQDGAELFGHAVAVQVGIQFEGLKTAEWESRHVRSLQRYEPFQGKSYEAILELLRSRYPAANRWIGRKRGTIMDYVDFLEDAKASRLA
jgi:hypothetical protein